MSLEACVGNRVAFERWRAVVQEQRDSMSPSMTVDYNYKLGLGLARFGQTKRAQIFLTTASQQAEQHKLNAWYFKIEDAIRRLSEAWRSQLQLAPRLRTPSERLHASGDREGLREYAAAWRRQ